MRVQAVHIPMFFTWPEFEICNSLKRAGALLDEAADRSNIGPRPRHPRTGGCAIRSPTQIEGDASSVNGTRDRPPHGSGRSGQYPCPNGPRIVSTSIDPESNRMVRRGPGDLTEGRPRVWGGRPGSGG